MARVGLKQQPPDQQQRPRSSRIGRTWHASGRRDHPPTGGGPQRHALLRAGAPPSPRMSIGCDRLGPNSACVGLPSARHGCSPWKRVRPRGRDRRLHEGHRDCQSPAKTRALQAPSLSGGHASLIPACEQLIDRRDEEDAHSKKDPRRCIGKAQQLFTISRCPYDPQNGCQQR